MAEGTGSFSLPIDIMPQIGPKAAGAGADPKKYNIKYIKADMDDITQMLELQLIETRGIRGDGVLLLSFDKMTFMDRYFIILKYMEAN